MAPNGTIVPNNPSDSSPGGPSPTDTGTSDRPRLTNEQKRSNHVASEKRRREALRKAFDILADIVPGMEGQGRSEAVMLCATVRELRKQIKIRMDIIEAMKAAGEDTTHLELPKEVIETVLEMDRDDPLLENRDSA